MLVVVADQRKAEEDQADQVEAEASASSLAAQPDVCATVAKRESLRRLRGRHALSDDAHTQNDDVLKGTLSTHTHTHMQNRQNQENDTIKHIYTNKQI